MGKMASFLKIVYFVYLYKMVKIPCMLISRFERNFRDGSNLNWVKSNNKFIGSTTKICIFHELIVITKIALFKFDIIYGLG